MGLYKVRVRVPGGEWTNWYDWATSSASELCRMSAAGPTVRASRPKVAARQLPPLEHTVGFDYTQLITPPPRSVKQISQMTPDEMRELVDEFTEEYITRPVQEFT